MTGLRVAVVCLGALLLQLTLFIDVRVSGVAPELLALVAILTGITAGSDRGSLMAFCAGLLWDLYLPTPLGLAAISFALAAYAVGSIESGLFHNTRVQIMVLTLLATAGAITVYALLGEVVGQRLIDDGLLRIVIISSVINAVLAPFVAPVIRWAIEPRTKVAAGRAA